jgi:hypothetical protein
MNSASTDQQTYIVIVIKQIGIEMDNQKTRCVEFGSEIGMRREQSLYSRKNRQIRKVKKASFR